MLDVDHPGFHDPEYRQRRDKIAAEAQTWRESSPIPTVEYTSDEHKVWQDVNRILAPLHAEFACDVFLQTRPIAQLSTTRIPQLSDVSRRIERQTGFRLVPVEGLVSPRVFLSALAEGRMLCTQYIRHHSVPLYTPEPDIVHELIGHVVMFFDSDYCALNREIGEAARVLPDESLCCLERLYWYSVEFGLVCEQGQTRAFGAGLLSSAGELSGIDKIPCEPFSPDAVVRAQYDTMHMHRRLFKADSVHHMYSEIRRCISDLRRRDNV